MLSRFEGESGLRLATAILMEQRIVSGDLEVARALLDVGSIDAVATGTELISAESADNSIYFVVSGSLEIVIGGKEIAIRRPGETVGELSWINPSEPRSANVLAKEESVVLTVTAEAMSQIADAHPAVYKHLSKDVARRLIERNRFLAQTNNPPRLFVASSTEALPIAQHIQLAFDHDNIDVSVWSDGAFVASTFPLESLEAVLEATDFAVALVHPDDSAERRGESIKVPRDNVIFELGLFVGRIGRHRTFLVEPQSGEVSLPSDLQGITTLPYRVPSDGDWSRAMGPIHTQLRNRIQELGPL